MAKAPDNIGIGIVGYGYWGPNLLRNFMEVPGARVVAVCDQSAERLGPIRLRYPTVETGGSYDALLANPAVHAVAIATPISTHFELAMKALRAGKHVLVEKPMTASAEEGRKLVDEAKRRGLTLMVDFTFIYTGAVRKMKELVSGGHLGKLYYYDSVRVNLGLIQHDVNVLWDLAVHDLAILDHVLGRTPVAVTATGIAHWPKGREDVAYLTCFFEDDFIAHFHVNWLAPVKVRRTLLGGDRQMIVYDDLAPDEKIRVYDKGVSRGGGADLKSQLVNYRTGDMHAPKLDRTEALFLAGGHFVDCIRTGKTPMTDGEAGLRVVRVLEAADRSLKEQGRRVDVMETA